VRDANNIVDVKRIIKLHKNRNVANAAYVFNIQSCKMLYMHNRNVTKRKKKKATTQLVDSLT